ncbi:related to Palmitoyltransferase PFA5 [Cephalotrichum gorgonifer]|uniref:Palmitoyltransferase n=1 Tax=Cephalotrichum gorgonifer TaxID=2041049 RepID=A0AAE8SXB0_9PEZI|nr:related to Palmitoyltransferase PFA5 [Cephalotrichum gorgonifer]
MSAEDSTAPSVKWMTRIIPGVLLLIVAYTTYVVVGRICVDFLLRERHETGLTVAFLVLYFVFLILGVSSYARTLWVVKTDPGFVPLHPTSRGARVLQNNKSRRGGTSRGGAFGRRYDDNRGDEEAATANVGYTMADQNPDSPGLETFYSRDIFVCEGDGRPKWCHDCGQWKPDRVSHSREVDRCVRKMDHFCPWVGGMVAGNSFKFFAQFTFYAWLLCAVALSASAYTLAKHLQQGLVLDGHVIAVIFFSSFLGLFSFGMSVTAIRFISKNMTNIDLVKKGTSYHLAVRVPLGTAPTDKFGTITYPLPKAPRAQLEGHVAPAAETERDARAKRTFAILRTEPGDEPWDLGFKRNWTEVMGHSPFDWLLPIKRPPSERHDSGVSEYPYGPLIAELRVRHGLDPKLWTDRDEAIEMREKRGGGRPV